MGNDAGGRGLTVGKLPTVTGRLPVPPRQRSTGQRLALIFRARGWLAGSVGAGDGTIDTK